MGINIGQQTTMFLYALLLGGVIGAVYDVFRVTRVAFHLSWALVLLEDLLFFLLSSILLWRFFLEQSGGEVRIFAVFGVLLGWLVYFLTIGNLVMKLSAFIVQFVTQIITAVLIPIKKITAAIKKYFNNIGKVTKLGKNRLKSRLHLLYNNTKRPRRQDRHKNKR